MAAACLGAAALLPLACSDILGVHELPNKETLKEGDAGKHVNGPHESGTLDSTFGAEGIAVVPLELFENETLGACAFSVVVDGQDVVVVVSCQQHVIYVLRCDPSGVFDSLQTAKILAFEQVREMAAVRAPGGNAVLIYSTRQGQEGSSPAVMDLTRVTAVGGIENVFHGEGYRDGWISLVRRGAGSVTVEDAPIGEDDGIIARAFLADGAPDSTFGSAGAVRVGGLTPNSRIRGAVVGDDESLVVFGGWFVDIETLGSFWLRLNRDGSVDRRFASDGFGKIAQKNSTTFAFGRGPAGYLIGGYSWDANGTRQAIAFQLTRDGKLDPSYGDGGAHRFPAPSADAIGLVDVREFVSTPDGRILVRGAGSPFGGDNFGVLARLSGREIDRSFGNSGIVVLDRGGERPMQRNLAIQGDGKILVAWAGSDKRLKLARYWP